MGSVLRRFVTFKRLLSQIKSKRNKNAFDIVGDLLYPVFYLVSLTVDKIQACVGRSPVQCGQLLDIPLNQFPAYSQWWIGDAGTDLTMFVPRLG